MSETLTEYDDLLDGADHSRRNRLIGLMVLGVLIAALPSALWAADYVVVDSGQDKCYNNTAEITCPAPGQPFYGQDAQYGGNQPSYALSGDGLTVFDNNTGLTWQRSPDLDGDGGSDADDKLTFSEFQAYPATLNTQNYGGYSDWRAPTIKELYSLIDFRGVDVNPNATSTDGPPFIDRNYFAFGYGDVSAGERIIDAQYWSNTQYVSTTMNGDATVFGVNFADGRIKGYPRDLGPGGSPMIEYVRCVRGNPDYGVNQFLDNGDGTVTDGATGLMWAQSDSGSGMNWQNALAWVQTKNSENYLGHNDWRLPSAKELQSIVDYTRSPDTTSSAAIDPLFTCTQSINEEGVGDYPFYWASTTHLGEGGSANAAVYIAFGRALGYMNGSWLDVHGAGAQRSDPKDGVPNPYGHGPQGDVIRIFNYVRVVRDDTTTPTPTPTPSPTATPTPTPTVDPAVGGVAELPDAGSPFGTAGSPGDRLGSSAPNYIALAALVAAALLALRAGAWYARRRWLRRRP